MAQIECGDFKKKKKKKKIWLQISSHLMNS